MMKKEKDTKTYQKAKKILFVILFIIIGLTMGLFLGKLFFTSKSCEEVKGIVIDENITKEYSTFLNSKIYLYNINEVELLNNDDVIYLSEYLKNYNSIDSLFASFDKNIKQIKKLYDGGTIIYQTNKNNELFKQNLTIIKCNTEKGNKDIYFAKNDINTTEAFKNGMCGKNFIQDTNFEKVYTIDKINILNVNDDGTYNVELTIKNDQEEVVITRVIDEETKSILKEKQKFTFYFNNKYKELVNDDMKYIFEHFTLSGVVPFGS